jgi:NAD(P)-dependent dehydrogenase (short-subunit alcohol dehydrogenase family)
VTTELRGRWALVTGASRGVGRQIALGLAEHGCNIVLHSRDLTHTVDLESELTSRGVRVAAVAAELSDQDQVNGLLDRAIEVSGGLDIVFNNAAIMTPWREPYIETPAEDFRLSFEVNVITPIRITYRVLGSMLVRRWGRIVQVTSGIREQPELTAYAISKAALDKFVLDTVPSLRGTGVLMNLLDPGWLRTDLGGPKAPNAVESVLPGALAPVVVDGEVHGVLFRAQDHVARA